MAPQVGLAASAVRFEMPCEDRNLASSDGRFQKSAKRHQISRDNRTQSRSLSVSADFMRSQSTWSFGFPDRALFCDGVFGLGDSDLRHRWRGCTNERKSTVSISGTLGVSLAISS